MFFMVNATKLRLNKDYLLYYTVWSNLLINGNGKEKTKYVAFVPGVIAFLVLIISNCAMYIQLTKIQVLC